MVGNRRSGLADSSHKEMKVISCLIILLLFLNHTFAFASDKILMDLIDARTGNRILFDQNVTKAVVFFTLMPGCPVVRKYETEILRIKKKFGDLVSIINIDPSVNALSERNSTIQYLKSTNNDLPLVIDDPSKIAKFLKLEIASEVALVNLSNNKVIYKGAINDRITINFDKPKATHNYLENAIESFLAGHEYEYKETKASGCLINISK